MTPKDRINNSLMALGIDKSLIDEYDSTKTMYSVMINNIFILGVNITDDEYWLEAIETIQSATLDEDDREDYIPIECGGSDFYSVFKTFTECLTYAALDEIKMYEQYESEMEAGFFERCHGDRYRWR